MEPEGSLPRSQEFVTFPFLSHINPMHSLLQCYFKIYFNIVLPSKPKSYKPFPSLGLPHQNSARISIIRHAHHKTRPFQTV